MSTRRALLVLPIVLNRGDSIGDSSDGNTALDHKTEGRKIEAGSTGGRSAGVHNSSRPRNTERAAQHLQVAPSAPLSPVPAPASETLLAPAPPPAAFEALSANPASASYLMVSSPSDTAWQVAAGYYDAALLALCAQLEDMRAEWQRLYDATSDADELTTPADHAWRAYSDDVWPHTALQPKGSTAPDVPALLLTHPATTLEGLQAKSAAILAINAAADYCDLRDDGLDLALSLARDAAGIAFCPVGAEAAQSITPLRPVPHGT